VLCYEFQLHLGRKNWICHFQLLLKQLCMPKIDLPSDHGATYSYAKSFREATLSNKRIGVMPLAYIWKFKKPYYKGARLFDIINAGLGYIFHDQWCVWICKMRKKKSPLSDRVFSAHKKVVHICSLNNLVINVRWKTWSKKWTSMASTFVWWWAFLCSLSV